jgi:hypothetical protein
MPDLDLFNMSGDNMIDQQFEQSAELSPGLGQSYRPDGQIDGAVGEVVGDGDGQYEDYGDGGEEEDDYYEQGSDEEYYEEYSEDGGEYEGEGGLEGGEPEDDANEQYSADEKTESSSEDEELDEEFENSAAVTEFKRARGSISYRWNWLRLKMREARRLAASYDEQLQRRRCVAA